MSTGNAYRIQADNAFLPDELKTMLAQANMKFFDITRIDTDFGIRTSRSVYDTTRFVTGVDGACRRSSMSRSTPSRRMGRSSAAAWMRGRGAVSR